MKLVYQDLNLNQTLITEGVNVLQEGLIPTQKTKIASYIAKKLTIKQRNYIVNNLSDSDFENLDQGLIESLLDAENLYELRASLDVFLILA